MPVLFITTISPSTCIFGIVAGILSVGFQLTYMLAFSRGKPVLVTTINNFSMFIPILVSCVFLDETFGIPKTIALVLATISLFLITSKEKKTDLNKSSSSTWIVFTLIAFLCNGLISANQKIYANMAGDFNVFSFVSITYITASVLLLAVLVVRRDGSTAMAGAKSALPSAGTAGIVLGTFQCVSTYAASLIDGVILYSVYNLSTNILFVFVRMVFFRERLSKKQIIGVCIALLTILFMK